MIEIIVVVLIVYVLIYVKNANQKKRMETLHRLTDRKPAGRTATESKAAKRGTPKASAAPNKPRVQHKTQKQEATAPQPAAVKKLCTYEAAYSKGKPSHIGQSADCETGVPSGMRRAVCGYCGAENFVPAGSHECYHCFFCWEKL